MRILFELVYDRYPMVRVKENGMAEDRELVAILFGDKTIPLSRKENPLGRTFIDTQFSQCLRDGVWLDAWGNPYNVVIIQNATSLPPELPKEARAFPFVIWTSGENGINEWGGEMISAPGNQGNGPSGYMFLPQNRGRGRRNQEGQARGSELRGSPHNQIMTEAGGVIGCWHGKGTEN